MSQYSGPKTAVNDFDASRWRDLLSNLFGDGILKSGHVQGVAGNDLAVTNPSNLNYSVNTGLALINGFLYASDSAAVTGTLAAADPSLPRIDTIILSWSYASGVPTCSVAVKQGTPASSPVPASLTQNDTTFEMSLATMRVNAGATTVALLTDTRVFCAALLPYTIGNASGNIPLSNGTVNTNFNADMVDGLHAASFALAAGQTFTGAIAAPGITSSSDLTVSNTNATVELGAKGSSNTPKIDFNSSGFSNDYDARIQVTGGTNAVNGAGTMNHLVTALQHNGSTIWTAANDGSGSGLDADTIDGHQPGSGNGLDADTVDGQHASAFLGVAAKAADSDKLDAIDSTGFLQVGSGNSASLPIKFIIVGPSAANLPAAGTKGRIAIVVPFSLP